MLSVALCTYNGAKYIKEQVQSILSQTMPVDEIVVCDDGSTDETVALIEGLRERATARIRIYVNETNLGVSANFQKAVDLCEGEMVFLSDQDDVWYPHKVKTIVEWFGRHPDKSVVFTDADLIDDQGETFSDDRLFDRVGFEREFRTYFDAGCELPLFYNCNHATGATMALRNRLPFGPYCSKEILHDEVIALMAIQRHELGYIPDALIQYRIHGSQGMSVPHSVEEAKQRFDFMHLLDPIVSGERAGRWPFPLTEELEAYQEFLAWRATLQNGFWGFAKPYLHVAEYKRFYHKKHMDFCLYDAKVSLKRLLRRIKLK